MTETVNLEQALVERGVNASLAAWYPACLHPAVIERTLAWYDRQGGRVGPGVLLDELRKGGRGASRDTASLLERQAAYGQEIVAWLRQHFPRWNRDDGSRTHPAAIACVIRLHHRLGRHLDPAEHRERIAAAVERFEAELGDGAR